MDKEKLIIVIKQTIRLNNLNKNCENIIDDYIKGNETAQTIAWFIIDELGLDRRYNRRSLLEAITEFEQENKQLNN